MVKKNSLPDGWLDYSKTGVQVPGTRFIAFKVPLKLTLCQNKLDPGQWFTPSDCITAIPNLKLVINLTNTNDGRYYDYEDFQRNGIEILLLKCAGQGTLPPQHIQDRFFQAVDAFMSATATADNEGLIGVHCTHGLNRTGYLICKYMIDRMGVPADNALDLFQKARGHQIERMQYVTALSEKTSPSESRWDGRNVTHYQRSNAVPNRDYDNYGQGSGYGTRGANQQSSYAAPNRDYGGQGRGYGARGYQRGGNSYGDSRGRAGYHGYGQQTEGYGSQSSFATRGRYAPRPPGHSGPRQTGHYSTLPSNSYNSFNQ